MHKSLLARSIAVLLAFWLCTARLASPVSADVTISAAPSLLEVSATPGGFGSQDITVTNAGTEPFTVTAEIAPYKGAEGNLSGLRWLTVDPASFELAPGQRRSVRVTIAVPSDAGSGGRYAMVAFRTGGKQGQGSTVGVAAQVGVPFLITVKGTGPLIRQPSLEGIVPVLEPNGGLGFRVPTLNKGNLHYYARGTIDVVESNGRPLGTVALRESTAILPGTREMLQSDQSLTYRDGATYRASAAVSLGEGAAEGRVATEFRATTDLEIEEVVPVATADGELNVRLQLKNKGELGLLPRVMMAIRGEDGKVAGVLSPAQQPVVWPGQSLEVEAKYPGKLSAGNYALVARAEFGTASVQREAPFKVAGSARAGSSVPVTTWAEATTKQSPEVAGALPIREIPVEPASSSFPNSQAGLLLLAGLGLMALVVFSMRRGRTPHSILEQIRLALPSPRAFGFGFDEQLGRRRPRYAPSPYRVEALPPPPIHLLPPPVQWREDSQRDGQPIVQLGTGSSTSPRDTRQEKAPFGEIPWSSTRAGNARGPENKAVHRTGPRAANRLTRAVAEKASTMVSEAAAAAKRGDRGAVDRLSRQALKLDPWNIDAWLWLAASCQDPKSAKLCLEAVLLLDPTNVKAKRGIASLTDTVEAEGIFSA